MTYRTTAGDALAGPVRSIRVATTLLDRFRTLMRGSTTDIELAIGEADQLYPEIWRHLDEAARALKAAGRSTGDYDAVRTHELAKFGVTDVEITRELDYSALMLGRLRTTQVKTASFNAAGYQVGREACAALMATLPEIDWAALAKAEDREILAAGSLRTASWIGAVKWFAIAAGLIAISVVLYRVLSSAKESSSGSSGSRPNAHEEKLAEIKRESDRRAREISTHRHAYEDTCSPGAKHLLLKALREEGQLTEAKRIEGERCRAKRPSCVLEREGLMKYFAERWGVIRDDELSFRCEGMMLPGVRGAFVPARFIEIGGTSERKGTYFYRGVVDLNRVDIVPMELSIEERFRAVADLDDDGVDELVFIGRDTLVITRVEDKKLVDTEAPVLPPGCSADVNIEADFRAGRKGERTYIVLDVPDRKPEKKCPSPGRHYMGLVDGKLVEID